MTPAGPPEKIIASMIRLFTPWYEAGHPVRQAELQECLNHNLANPHFGQICLWQYSGKAPGANPKLCVRTENRQPTFDDFFAWAGSRCAPGEVAIIANTDVWFDETLPLTENIRPKQCFALLRWESNGRLFSVGGNARRDSQDAWVFRTPIPPVGADFGLGRLRCDNALAYRLWQLGFELRNPAKSIRIHHVHTSDIRPSNYNQIRIPPPWLHIEPAGLDEPGSLTLIRKTFSLKWLLVRLQQSLKAKA